MTRLIDVEARTDGSLIIGTYSETLDHLWLGTGSPVRVSSSVSDAELGDVLVRALRESRHGIERPERLDQLMKPKLKVAGVRSQRAYYEGTRSIAVSEEDDGTIQVEPSRRRQREFLPLRDRFFTLHGASSEELAKAVREGLERSEG